MGDWSDDDEDTRRSLYQSVPLDFAQEAIRLLHLHPGHFDDPIQCELSVASLSTYEDYDLIASDLFGEGEGPSPPYEALSYTWGSHTPQRPVSLNNGANLGTTENLFQALRNLRRKDRSRVLWVDALCINQHDHKEKSHQIQLMGKIFALAGCVLVWLGVYGARSDSVDAVKHPPDMDLILNQLAPSDTFRATEPPWETRVWTLQEFIMARQKGRGKAPRICIGTEETSCQRLPGWEPNLQNFEKSMQFDAVQRHLEHLDDMRLYMPAGGNDIFQLLSTALKMNARDPRDKVYSLLAILPQGERQCLQPDYTKSIAEVWTTATFASISFREALDILLFAAADLERPEGLPSWSANFGMLESSTATGFASVHETVWEPFKPWLIPQPECPVPYKPTMSSDQKSLTVYGKTIDHVRIVACIEEMYLKGNVEQILRFRRRDSEEDIAEWNFSSERPLRSLLYTKAEDGLIIKKLFKLWTAPPPDGSSEDDRDLFAEHAARMLQVEEWSHFFTQTSNNFAVFVTEAGALGFGAKGIAVGDEIVQLFGGLAAVVLSPMEGGRGRMFRGFAPGTWMFDMVEGKLRELAEELVEDERLEKYVLA